MTALPTDAFGNKIAARRPYLQKFSHDSSNVLYEREKPFLFGETDVSSPKAL